MGLDFDWTTNDDEQQEAILHRTGRAPKRRLRPWLIGVAIVALLAAVGWTGYQFMQRRNQAALQQAAQIYQQLQQQAIRSQNGSLFQSVNASAPAWLSAQLQPRSWRPALSNPQIEQTVPHLDGLIATIQWREKEALLQRDIFYMWRQNTLVQAPIPVDYWGDIFTIQQPWGRLTVREADRPWADEITQFVNHVIAQECNAGCRSQRLPFALTVRSSFSTTAAPRQVVIASPRLWALDAVGNPASPFWQALERELHNQLAPANIRFAAPALLVDRLQRLADQFTVEHPTIELEIVALESLPPAPDQLLAQIDGAYMSPTMGMITSGLIYDLTDFADSDPQVEAGDFEPRIWQAAQWKKRLWMLPQSATMRILFYDRAVIEELGLTALPVDDWARFEQMLKQARQRAAAPNATALFDIDADILAAYASHLHCPTQPATSRNHAEQQQAQAQCLSSIEPTNWAAALAWYRSAVVDSQTIMNLSTSPPIERENLALQIKSLPLRTVVWTEHPANYEHYQQLHKLGIAPLPGGEMESITPLRLHGSLISQQASNPQAVWQWINYLTFERPLVQTRDIPARRSVATAIGYWGNLPTPLRVIMHDEFARARPVLLEEAEHLEWQKLAPLLDGIETPGKMAQQIVDPPWFMFAVAP
ncbi:MAG: hypothetical protein R3A44_22165 [Caldilineaceae bacterium]